MKEHLKEEELLTLLLGQAQDLHATHHLQICSACRKEVRELQEALTDYKELSLAWAEHTEMGVASAATSTHFWTTHPAWAFALAIPVVALLVLFFSLPSSRPWPHPYGAVSITRDSAAQIAADNRVLEAMDQDLRYSSDAMYVPASELKSPREPNKVSPLEHRP